MDVLLIDDDEDTTFLISLLLKRSEAVETFTIKKSALDALEYLEGRTSLPDCILVDLQMPEMNGFEFIERFESIYSGEIVRNIQVYILSSTVRPSDRDRAISYESVKDFILKPLTNEKLLQIREKQLSAG